MSSAKGNTFQHTQIKQEIEVERRSKKPDMYCVVLLNDDYTPQEFVIWVLMKVFYKSNIESNKIMLDAHNHGRSRVGVYTFDIARTKVLQVKGIAEKNGHPLECILEVESGSEE